MNFNITIIERMLLETIHQGPKNNLELEDSTGLKREVLQKVLMSLLTKGLLQTNQDSKYSINTILNKNIKDELYDKANITVEIGDIINSCTSQVENIIPFKLKKVYLTQKDESLLRTLLYSVESFLDNVKTKSNKISQQKIIFWGGNSYENIINNTLNY